MNELLRVILTRADVPEASVFSADEVVRWPPGALDLLLRSGLLRETAPANGLVCDQCEEACWIEPDIREDPKTGKAVGTFFCTRREDIGHFTVDLERLGQWEAHLSGLAAAVAKALTAIGEVQEIMPDRLYQLGKVLVGGRSREAFLARGLNWHDGASVLSQATRSSLSPTPVVFVPAIAPLRPGQGDGPLILPLKDIAFMGNDGLTIDLSAIGEESTPMVAPCPLTVKGLATFVQRSEGTIRNAYKAAGIPGPKSGSHGHTFSPSQVSLIARKRVASKGCGPAEKARWDELLARIGEPPLSAKLQ